MVPRYDLALVAPQMLRAQKGVAKLGAEASTALDLFSGLVGTIFFWTVLALVVVLPLVDRRPIVAEACDREPKT